MNILRLVNGAVLGVLGRSTSAGTEALRREAQPCKSTATGSFFCPLLEPRSNWGALEFADPILDTLHYHAQHYGYRRAMGLGVPVIPCQARNAVARSCSLLSAIGGLP